MKLLITGARGFIGKNLIAELENLRDGREQSTALLDLCRNAVDPAGNPTPLDPSAIEILPYDTNATRDELERYCQECDFVIHFAGVNRPKEEREFMEGNHDLLQDILDLLKATQNTAPVLLSSSIQAELDNPYGKSKKAAEDLLEAFSAATGTKAYIYRFPNVFGKWCRPDYNSAVATFCNQIAHNLPIQVNDPNREMHLVYIDDLVEEIIATICGHPHPAEPDSTPESAQNGNACRCAVSVTHRITLGEIADLVQSFPEMRRNITIPDVGDAFTKKLYSTYLSYLPEDKLAEPLQMNRDERGFFTELLRTEHSGQCSINVSKPGITKGQHWHHTKVERFVVVSGHGLIQLRRIGTDTDGQPYPVIEYEVDGDHLQAVEMIPGYAHNLINLSDTQDLVTFIWSNEPYDNTRPDTYREIVE